MGGNKGNKLPWVYLFGADVWVPAPPWHLLLVLPPALRSHGR